MITGLKLCSEVPFPHVAIHLNKIASGHHSAADPQIRGACKLKRLKMYKVSRETHSEAVLCEFD